MIRLLRSILAVALFWFPISSICAQILKSDYSAPILSGGFVTYSSTTTPVDFGWVVDSGSIDHIGSFWQGSSHTFGDQPADLSGSYNMRLTSMETPDVAVPEHREFILVFIILLAAVAVPSRRRP